MRASWLRDRRVPVVTLLVAGVLLALAGGGGLWAGIKADEVADLVRPEMTDSGLAQHRKDFETGRATFAGLRDDVLPALAAATGQPPTQLVQQVSANYPAIGALLAQQDQIVPFAEQSLVNLEKQQHNFQRADALPLRGLPGWSSAVADFVLAALVLGAAAFLLRGGQDWRAHAAFATLGACALVLIVVPLTLEVPQKAGAAQTVLDSLNPSDAVVQRTRGFLTTAEDADQQLNQQLIPDFATAFGVQPAALQALLQQQFPQTAAGLQAMPAVLQRYEARFAIRAGGAADLRDLKSLPVGLLGWVDPAFGVLLAAATGWALLAARRVAGRRDEAGAAAPLEA